MAEGVRKSFRRNFIQKLEDTLEDAIEDNGSYLPHADIKGLVDDAVRTADSITSEELCLGNSGRYDTELAEALSNEVAEELGFVMSGNLIVARARKRAYEATDRDTYQAMESFVHNLNTLHSRCGAQVEGCLA